MSNNNELVITGLGAVTSGAVGLEAHWLLAKTGGSKRTPEDYSLATFNPAPHLSDRRMLKAVSSVDAIGLAAVEGLRKQLALDGKPYAAEKIGLYVGAPPASAFDNAFYVDAMEASRVDGKVSVTEFGATCMSAKPTTLLIGLPNNVLCYGAMLVGARGPNSNYNSGATSGALAVINAARRVKRGQLDLAVAGAFSANTEAVNSGLYKKLGLVRAPGGGAYAVKPFAEAATEAGTVIADGSAFVAIERRNRAEARGAKALAVYCGGATASDGMGPLRVDTSGAALEGAVRKALAEAGAAPSSIGLVLACATGVPSVDQCEFSVLSRVFANERELPALGNSTPLLGNLGEAGGVLELGYAALALQEGALPKALGPQGYAADSGFGTKIDTKNKPYALILRATPWGEYACVVIRGTTF